MGVEVTRLVGPVRAEGACEGLLAGVDPVVLLEIVLLVELFGAHRASKPHIWIESLMDGRILEHGEKRWNGRGGRECPLGEAYPIVWNLQGRWWGGSVRAANFRREW